VPGEGAVAVLPPTAVLSFVRRKRPFDAATITSFCHFVHFFRDDQAARDWTSKHGGSFVVSIQDGFEIGRATNRARFGAALR